MKGNQSLVHEQSARGNTTLFKIERFNTEQEGLIPHLAELIWITFHLVLQGFPFEVLEGPHYFHWLRNHIAFCSLII